MGDLLGQALKKNGLERGLRRGKALLLWPDIAGPALSEWTEADRLEDGVLFVKTRDAVVNHQLTYMRGEFVRRYAEKLPGAVREIRFQVGELYPKPRPGPQTAPLPKLSGEEETQVRLLASQAPQELQGVIAGAAKAVKRRQKDSPHPLCVVCGAPSAQNPCPGCRRLLGEAAVLNEAKRLLRHPLKPRLEGEPLSAARYIAQGRLEAQMRDLLPEVVQHSELFPVLQDTARRYLQLRTGEKDVTKHRALLPPTLQSLLREL